MNLTASKENTPRRNRQSSTGPLLPAPLPRLCPREQRRCILYCLLDRLPWSELLRWIICALTCAVLGFLRPAGLACYQRMQRLLYLEEQSMGNIDLLKGIRSCFPFIPASPFKVKMVWQDKGVVWRVVCGLWGHRFRRPGVNSLHTRSYSTICLYSMCRFRLAEEMHLSSAGKQQSRSTNIKCSCLLVG